MQQIERVGAVALLFLLVTIVAVAMWDDGKSGEVNAARPEADERTASDGGEDRVEQQATRGRQRPQASQNEQQSRAGERHDGLQATRANERADRNNLMGGSGQVAQVPGRGAAPLQRDPTPAPVQEGHVLPGNDRVIEGTGDQQLLNERGWDNGRRGSIQEDPVSAEKVAERPARKRKQDTEKAEVRIGGQSHVVQMNESLERIARARLGDAQRWPEIAAINGIDGPNYLIRVGQSLRLPGGAMPPQEAAPARPINPTPRAQVASNRSVGGRGRTYKIKSGDVLGVISQRELGTSKRWNEIVALNPGLDPKKLLVGTTILLPAGGTPAPERSTLVADVRADTDYRVR
ncbi:MAG: LysM peptidoglycan-binding domain-containing protein [Planctomycetota bacterium]|nr:LysM peptidoglycan-binding domain-containing protein [Planctomycetota bacterium]